MKRRQGERRGVGMVAAGGRGGGEPCVSFNAKTRTRSPARDRFRGDLDVARASHSGNLYSEYSEYSEYL